MAPAGPGQGGRPGGVVCGVGVVAGYQELVHSGVVGVGDHRAQARRPRLTRVVESRRLDNHCPHPT